MLTRCSLGSAQTSVVEDDHELQGQREDEAAIARQEALANSYFAGHDAGLEAGKRAEASKHQTASADTEEAYARGFAAGQRRLMKSEVAFAFARGQQAEHQRIRACLEEVGIQDSRARDILDACIKSSGSKRDAAPASALTPDASVQQSRQYPSRDSEISRASLPATSPESSIDSGNVDSSLAYSYQAVPQTQAQTPAPTSEGATVPLPRGRPRVLQDGRKSVATCVFCGVQVSQNSILRHKRRHHPAELAAVGVPLHGSACWWPGCGQLQDNFVHEQLTTHLQRKHNYSPPGDSHAFTENIKYISRMPIDLQISIIAEAAQQLNEVKLRIQDLEARLRRLKPLYVSRHGLPDLRQLHESRVPVLSALLNTRDRLPHMIQELRQLTRARGIRSQLRDDEGTWWEVADDLEAALDPSGQLAQAVAALPAPDIGPTVHVHANTFAEAPDMNDPSWRPQYAIPLQTGWDVTGPDDNPVWTRASTGAPGSRGGAAESAVELEAEDDEEDGQELMAEISRRVLDDTAQSDWDQSSSDDDGSESVDPEDDVTQDVPDPGMGWQAPQRWKRSAATDYTPRRAKHHKAA